MALEFDFVPHDINNIFQNIKHTTAFSRHLLISTKNQLLWDKLVSIDPYSLCINRNDSIHIVIYILQTLNHFVPFYAQQHNIKNHEVKEIKSYETLLVYLQDRLKNGKPKTYKKIVRNK